MSQARINGGLLAACLGVLAGACTPALVGLEVDCASNYGFDAGSALTARTMPAIGLLTALRSLELENFEGVKTSEVRKPQVGRVRLVTLMRHRVRTLELTLLLRVGS